MNGISIIGLPSEVLRNFAERLHVQHIEFIDTRSVNDDPNRSCDTAATSIAPRLNKLFQDVVNHGVLLVYQPPWTFLEHQTKEISAEKSHLGSIAKRSLDYWYALHITLLALYRKHGDRCLLINVGRPDVEKAAAALVEERFGIRSRSQPDFPTSGEFPNTTGTHESIWCQIVNTLSPQCLDLYSELESCAELNGSHPQSGMTGITTSDVQVEALLQLLAHQCRITKKLDQHGVQPASFDLQQLDGIPFDQLDYKRLEERLKVGSRMNSSIEDKLSHLIKERDCAWEFVEHMCRKILDGKTQAESLKRENELYLLKLHQTQEELERYLLLYRKKNQQLAELKQEPDHPHHPNWKADISAEESQKKSKMESVWLTHEMMRRMRSLRKSAASCVMPLVKGIRHWKNERTLKTQTKTIRASKLFDETWYLQTYRDVARAGPDPIEHYLKHGAIEGRNPSPHFDTKWYFQSYPDVAAAGINPLLHFIQYGKVEGRIPMRKNDPENDF